MLVKRSRRCIGMEVRSAFLKVIQSAAGLYCFFKQWNPGQIVGGFVAAYSHIWLYPFRHRSTKYSVQQSSFPCPPCEEMQDMHIGMDMITLLRCMHTFVVSPLQKSVTWTLKPWNPADLVRNLSTWLFAAHTLFLKSFVHIVSFGPPTQSINYPSFCSK